MLVKRGNKWSIVVWRDGKRKWISTGLEDKRDAEMLEKSLSLVRMGNREKFLKIVDAIYGTDSTQEEANLGTLIDEYPMVAKTLAVKVSEETMRKRRNAIGRLAKWISENVQGVSFARGVSVPIAWRFVESIQATANTQRKVVGELSAVWESLMKRGLADENPWKVAKPQKDASVQKHGRAFTIEEIKRILDACSEDWQRHAVTIGLYTGLRLGDIFRLKWEDVSFADSLIRSFKPSKTARHDIEVCLPLHDALKGYLSRFRAPSGRIVKATCDADRFGEYFFTSILEKARIEAKENERISFHCLRHTFASMLASAGATEQERMRLGGWSSAKTASLYNHDLTREKEILSCVPNILVQ